MHADIYIASSLKGMRRQDGVVGFVIETMTGKGPATLTQFGIVRDATPNQADLLAVKFALKRINPECEVTFHLDNSYIAAAVEKGWLAEWKMGGWKNSKGAEIANKPEWEAVSELIGERAPSFEVGKDHGYRSWLESEVKKRSEKHKKT